MDRLPREAGHRVVGPPARSHTRQMYIPAINVIYVLSDHMSDASNTRRHGQPMCALQISMLIRCRASCVRIKATSKTKSKRIKHVGAPLLANDGDLAGNKDVRTNSRSKPGALSPHVGA